ncbi:MAG: secretin N-terminal domain-containing protein [Armatimonadota bacterium]|nr:hypothetical protein [bacterium]
MKLTNVSRLLIVIIVLMAAFAVAGWTADTPARDRITIDITDMSLNDALQQIFESTSQSYVLDPAITDLKVTAHLRNATLDAAVKAIINTAGILYNSENGVWQIFGHNGVRDAKHPSDTKSEVVNVQYLTAAELAPILAKSGKLTVTVTSNNKLVLAGAAKDVSEALELIKALDVAPKMVKTVSLKLVLKTNHSGECRLSAQGVGPEGSPMSLWFTKETPNLADSAPDIISVNITPVCMSDGRVQVTGTGIVRWTGISQFDIATVNLNFSLALEQDKPIVVASGDTKMHGDAGYDVLVRHEIFLTANVEPGEVPAASPQPQAKMPDMSCDK